MTVPDRDGRGPALLRVVGGSPTDDEIAAVTVAVMAVLSGSAAAEPDRSADIRRRRRYTAPSSWRNSA